MLHIATLEAAVHLIQVALTPVFLLSGIAALLGVFSNRLARVADQLRTLLGELETCDDATRAVVHREIGHLHRRSQVLDGAVVLGTVAAAATCLAILTLFLQALSNRLIASILVGFFGLAILCTLGSVAAFGIEMLMTSRGIRLRMLLRMPWLGEAT